MDEEGLREFLMKRILDGYTLPMNPIWLVRDEGWYELYEALKGQPEGLKALEAWFPPESGIMKRIEEVHGLYPDGFVVADIDTQNSRNPTVASVDLSGLERADVMTVNKVAPSPSNGWGKLRTVCDANRFTSELQSIVEHKSLDEQ